jgi:acyl dehydratase
MPAGGRPRHRSGAGERVRLNDLRPGARLGPSGWVEIDQRRIDGFAASTGDAQWIHTDPERAAAGPFGATVAHGLLTLSLLSTLFDDVVVLEDATTSINYGLDRVRFPAPVPVGSRIRARFIVASVAPVDGGVQAAFDSVVEREGSERPVCVATIIFRLLRE